MSNASAVKLSLGAQEVLYLAVMPKQQQKKWKQKSLILHLIHMLYLEPFLLMAL